MNVVRWQWLQIILSTPVYKWVEKFFWFNHVPWVTIDADMVLIAYFSEKKNRIRDGGEKVHVKWKKLTRPKHHGVKISKLIQIIIYILSF